jgi:transposase-like protein
MSDPNRRFGPEFRVQVAQRILQGESVSKLHHELDIKRSVLYRWRDRYRKEGAAGFERRAGRPPGVPNAAPKPNLSAEELLRQQIAILERKVGQQALQLDFFKGAFKRVKESNQAHGSAGKTASTRRSGR